MGHPIEALTVMTRGEVGEALGISRETVRQIEVKALRKIREAHPELLDYWFAMRTADPIHSDYSWGGDWDRSYDWQMTRGTNAYNKEGRDNA